MKEMNSSNDKPSEIKVETNRERRILLWLYILPPIILLLFITFYSSSNINLEEFTPFILPSVGAGISLVIGLSTRNASISERARSKAAELLNYRNEGEDKFERRECLYQQMIRFEHRFQLNQIALFIAWTSLYMGLFIGFILSYGHNLDWIAIKLPILIISLLSYSFLITLLDIMIGSTTLNIELRNVEIFYKGNRELIKVTKL